MDYREASCKDNARWYSPSLGRFISADTIVPEVGNSQAWNRYAYVVGNPIAFVDPSGHVFEYDEGPSCYGPGCPDDDDIHELINYIGREGCDSLSNGYCIDEKGNLESSEPGLLDAWIWAHIPSGLMLDVGGDLQFGYGMELAVSVDISFVFNLYSGRGQFYLAGSVGQYIGLPNVFEGSGHAGSGYIFGASSNAFLEGLDYYSGLSLQADTISDFGVEMLRSVSLNEGYIPGSPISAEDYFLDPVSNLPIQAYQTNIVYGADLISNGFDFGVIQGYSYSIPLSGSIDFWHIR